MTKEERKNEKHKKVEFKPDIRAATAVIGAVAFLQKIGFSATPKNIKLCINQRCRKPANHIMESLPNYLNRGLELGILRKFNGVYKLGKFDIKKRKKKYNKIQHEKKSNSTKSTEKSNVAAALLSKDSVVC